MAAIYMNDEQMRDVVERAHQAALDAGAAVIQKAFGALHGDLAAQMLTGDARAEAFRELLADYAKAEEVSTMREG